MNKQVENFDSSDIVDILGIYESKIELMHYMLEVMRREVNTLKNSFGVHEDVLRSTYNCLEVMEQLSYDNLNYVQDEVKKYSDMTWSLLILRDKIGLK